MTDREVKAAVGSESRQSGGAEPCAPRVLIVDQSADNRTVLRTVLERRGMRILEAREPQAGLQLARRFHPQLILLDLADEIAEADAEDSGWQAAYRSESEQSRAALVILGRVRGPLGDVPPDQVVGKPYHFGPLIRKIEEMLG